MSDVELVSQEGLSYSRPNEPATSPPPPRVLPSLVLCGNSLWCDDKVLSLERKPLTRKLFEIFLRNPEKPLSREDLMVEIYEDVFHLSRSDRYRQALAQNIVKLISRARHQAEGAFCGDTAWMEWFCYDADRGTWSLFRLSHKYIQEKEKQWRVI